MKTNRPGHRRRGSADLAIAYLGALSVDELRLHHVVARHIERVLAASDDNLSLAAELLGLNRRTMQRYAHRRRRRGPARHKVDASGGASKR